MKKWKGIVSLFLVFTLMLLSVPLPPVLAETVTEGTTPDGIRYRLEQTSGSNDYEMTIIGYDPEKLQAHIILPTEINGYHVTNMEAGAFQNCTILESLAMTDGKLPRMDEISEYAFSGCVNLKEVTLSRIHRIGSYAFYGCTSLEKIDLDRSDYIQPYAFAGCVNLGGEDGVVSLEGVRSVSDYAFSGCVKIKKFLVDRYLGIRGLGEGAFYGCTLLEEITLSPYSRIIPSSAFEGCSNLKKVISGDQDLKKIDEIGDRAFAGCVSLEELDSMQAIEVGEEAFRDCGRLKNISFLGGSVEKVGRYAFRNCDNLREASIRWGNMEEGVFYDCDALETVRFTSSGSVGSKTFANCKKLKEVIMSTKGTNVSFASDSFEGSPNVIIYGYEGSRAQVSAAEHGYTFSVIIPEKRPEPESTELTYDGRTYKGSIMFDTDWYVMPDGPLPGNPTANLYDIGIVMAGNAAEKELRVYSSRDGVAGVHKLPNGNYRVTGKSEGTSYIMLEVWDNGKMLNHYSVRISVQKGMWPYGQSARKRSYFN